jgi:tetratricopeptide (TPR) repeat protein
LRRRVRQVVTDLEMVVRLEDIRLRTRSTWKDSSFDVAGADQEYASAFRDYGIDVEALSPAEAGRQLQARAVRVELAAALDDWAEARREVSRKEDRRWKDLLAVARGADGDELRGELRQAVERGDRKALEKLASAASLKDLPVPTVRLLGKKLLQMGAVRQAVAVLRVAQRLHPEDFWLNFDLAGACDVMQPPLGDETIRFYTAARAIRPDNTATLTNLGRALHDKGELDEAIREYRTAIEIDPKHAFAHNNLGNALKAKGELDEAIREYRTAIEIDPKDARAHYNLGAALRDKGQLDEAIRECRAAVALDPKLAMAHNNLGVALSAKGKVEEAIAHYRQAIHLDPKLAKAHNNLGDALR